MISVDVRINNKYEVALLSATRTYPNTCDVEEGIECTYTLKYHDTPVGTMKNTYGCGIELAKSMLDWFKDNKETIKLVHIALLIKDKQGRD